MWISSLEKFIGYWSVDVPARRRYDYRTEPTIAYFSASAMQELDFEPSDKIAFGVDSEEKITLKTIKYLTVASLRGAAGKLNKPLSWEEMRQITREDR